LGIEGEILGLCFLRQRGVAFYQHEGIRKRVRQNGRGAWGKESELGAARKLHFGQIDQESPCSGSISYHLPHSRFDFCFRPMGAETLNQFAHTAHIAVGPRMFQSSSNFGKSRKRLATSMQIQPVLMTTFGKIHLRPDPVLASFDLCQPPRCFSFDKRFSFALFTLSPRLGNEQPTITECAHVIRKILVRVSLEHVVDAIWRPQIGHQMVGAGACRTGITTLVVTDVRMIL